MHDSRQLQADFLNDVSDFLKRKGRRMLCENTAMTDGMSSDIIGVYVYNVGLGQAKYSYTAAIGLFQNLIGFVMILTVNTLAKKLGSVSMF